MYHSPAPRQPDYGTPQLRPPREVEYDLFAQVTSALRACDRHGKGPAAIAALTRNSEMWSALAADLVEPGNALPGALKGQLLSLANFSIRHASRVLAGEGDTAILLDININIMKGLRGSVAP